jgi:hypothetical protein
MSSGPARERGNPAEYADATGTADQHDETGRAGGAPYVPAGRDQAGRPQPAVPHEGLVGRLATSLLLGQSVVLAVVVIWAVVILAGSGAPAAVLGLQLGVAEVVLLAVTAVLGAASCLGRRWSRRWAATQFGLYLLVFLVGLTLGGTFPELNTADHALHAVLALLGFVALMLLSARIVEPPPGADPYPNNRTDAPDAESSRDGRD